MHGPFPPLACALAAAVALLGLGGAPEQARASMGLTIKQAPPLSTSIPTAVRVNHRCGDVHSITRPPAYQRRAFMCLANRTRAFYQLPALRAEARLARASAMKAARIAACKRMSHRPCNDQVAQQTAKAGYHAGMGENLFAGGGRSISPWIAYAAWMRSPAHRANLLNPGWRAQGVALRKNVRLDGYLYGALWVHQMGAR